MDQSHNVRVRLIAVKVAAAGGGVCTAVNPLTFVTRRSPQVRVRVRVRVQAGTTDSMSLHEKGVMLAEALKKNGWPVRVDAVTGANTSICYSTNAPTSLSS